MIHKKVVRDFHVWCAKSKIRISGIGIGQAQHIGSAKNCLSGM